MLTLIRKHRTAVIIGELITLRVIETAWTWVTVEVAAPAGTTVAYLDSDDPREYAIGGTLTLPRKLDNPARVRITLPDGRACVVRAFKGGRNHNAVKLGFEAPRQLSVHREEVAQRIAAQASHGARPVRHLALVGLLCVALAGCATGDELRSAWALTVGRAGECRIVEHRASSERLETRTTWRGKRCRRQVDGNPQAMAIDHAEVSP